MHRFGIRVVNIVVIIGVLLGYNSVLQARTKDEEIAKLSAQLETVRNQIPENEETAADTGSYKDGTYTGEGNGFGGKISVEVKVEDKQIKEINILSAEKEDGAYLAMAEDIIPVIIEAQNADVDTVGGATFSSTGIKEAALQALEKAVE